MKLKRYNSDVYQIINNEGNVVAFATKYSNELWGISNTDDKRLVGAHFKKPKEAFKFYVENLAVTD